MENSTGPNRSIRVALLELEPLRVAGLREIFASRRDIQVCNVDLADALTGTDIDLLILKSSPGTNLCALLDRLRARQPQMKMLVIGMDEDEEATIAAIGAGAKGWLHEAATPEQVRQAVNIVLSGSIWAPRRVLSKVVDRALAGTLPPAQRELPRFTSREEQVLQQLVMARSNREIAQALRIREQTVKSYVAQLMRKMGVDNRIALSMQAAEGDWWRKKKLS